MAEAVSAGERERDTLRTQLGGGNTAGASVLVSLKGGAPGTEQAGHGCSYSLGHMWVPEPLETALGPDSPPLETWDCPHLSTCARSPPPGQAPGPHMDCFIRSFRKQHRAPKPTTTCPQQAAYSNLQRSPLTGTTSPRQRGKGCRPAGPVQGTWCSGGPGTAAAGPHCPDNLTRPRCSELRPVPRPEALPCPGRYGPQARTGAKPALYLVVWVVETEHPPLSSHSEARMAEVRV